MSRGRPAGPAGPLSLQDLRRSLVVFREESPIFLTVPEFGAASAPIQDSGEEVSMARGTRNPSHGPSTDSGLPKTSIVE